ncbi:MAG TPA: Asp-tRNA(Asn)/Glu-tRNA(Gln) amidotransferase subunit GatA [Vicinamibacterales bacterium]|nr:Asp-tRNA(Asn)/Glu-tRNA(Gln) amidotransferase subunit GatA [Vicinamibacterales bacterium]
MPDLPHTAAALRAVVADRTVSAEEVCRQTLERIAALDGRLHAFLHVDADRALDRARALDRLKVPAGPLHGVPIALKDNVITRDMPTTAGSHLLDGHRPLYNATVVDRLERAGAVIVGKTVCDEFAMGSSTEHCAFGPARNPWALDRVPGGSSGGSAVAVAAGLVPIALGSDTGGSIRQPAAFCGIVGLKPTYGRVSRYGLIAFASSLDQIGPLAHSVDDAALVLSVIGGHDPLDATSAAGQPFEAAGGRRDDLRGVRIGVPRALLETGVAADVTAAFDAALGVLTDLGATIVTIDLPHSRFAVPVYYLVATAEASSNLARYDGVRYGVRAAADSLGAMYDRTRSAGFGAEVKRRIMLGTYALSAGYYDAYYRKAQQVRTLIARDFDTAFDAVDLVALPTTPTTAFRFGAHLDDPLSMYVADVFTVSAPLAGLPAVSVPAGLSSEHLPIGLQLVGRAWDEAGLLRAAGAYERRTPWAGRRPRVLDA